MIKGTATQFLRRKSSERLRSRERLRRLCNSSKYDDDDGGSDDDDDGGGDDDDGGDDTDAADDGVEIKRDVETIVHLFKI